MAQDNDLSLQQLREVLAQGEQRQQRQHGFGTLQMGSTPSFPSLASSHLALSTDDLINALQNSPSPPVNPLYAGVPSAAPQPIPLATANRAPYPSHSFDTNFYDDAAFPLDNYSFGTPSYAGSYTGSWGSSHTSAASNPSSYANEPPHAHAGFDFLHQQYRQSLHQQQFIDPSSSSTSGFNPLLDYREVNYDPAREDESVYGGGAASDAGDSAAGSVSGAGAGVRMDFAFDPTISEGVTRSQSPYGGLEIGGEPYGQGQERQGQGGTLLASRQYSSSDGQAGVGGASTSAASSHPSTPFVFATTLSESPPTSSADFRTSPPALPPLAIPSDSGPSFNLIQPTPHTARPGDKQKGPGTLELESLLGMGEWPVKREQRASCRLGRRTARGAPVSHKQVSALSPSADSLSSFTDTASPSQTPPSFSKNSSFSDFTPLPGKQPHSSPQPLFANSVSAPPEQFDSSAPPSLQQQHFPSQDLPFGLSLPRQTPTRQRSKSEADITHPPQFPPGGSTAGAPPPHPHNYPYYFYPPFHTVPNGHPLLPLAQPPPPNQFSWGGMNPADAYRPPPSHHPPADLSSALDLEDAGDVQDQQHALASRSRSSMSGRRPVGGPGYYEAGMFGIRGDDQSAGTGGMGHRRARSHGAGHVRNARSDDLTYLVYGGGTGAFAGGVGAAGGPLPMTLDDSGLLAPPIYGRPTTTAPQSQSRSQSPSSHSGFAPPPPSGFNGDPNYGGGASDQASGSASASGSGSKAPYLGPQRTPYVYHSPVASPRNNSMERGPSPNEGRAGSDDGGMEVMSTVSKTTPATIEAAMRRRNPGTAAKFVCDLCGETFTRRYNLRGHQRAHRNEKPFACSYEGCGKAFARSHDCKRHELLHLNVRRYSCEPCKRDFVRLDALQRHHRSEVGQACVDQLRAAGYVIPYDTTASDVAL